MITWLRRQHESWRGIRTIMLVGAVIAIVFSIVYYLRGEPSWHVLPLFLVACYGLSYTLGSWAGRPEVSLLLKLIEERMDEEN